LYLRAHVANMCPVFDHHLVVPQDIAPENSADVSVLASDPDGADGTLTYVWSATSGTFTELLLPKTTYRCAAPGAAVLAVHARDVEGCESELLLDVQCLEE
jgi:hypothetical protein